jgi:hypothetical protein
MTTCASQFNKCLAPGLPLVTACCFQDCLLAPGETRRVSPWQTARTGNFQNDSSSHDKDDGEQQGTSYRDNWFHIAPKAPILLDPSSLKTPTPTNCLRSN